MRGVHGGFGTAKMTRKTPGHYRHTLMQSLAFNTSIFIPPRLGIHLEFSYSFILWQRQDGRGEMGEIRGEKRG